MFEATLSAFQNLFGCPCVAAFLPLRIILLIAGVFLGLSLGAIPGLGGLVGLAMLLPFTFEMDPFMAFALMIGIISVTSTSDTIPSVLFAVPGTVASQATILDGHPMARRGEAGRAFGAAYTASLLGGLFGACVLALSIPILRPLVLSFGSPEFFMLGVFGISMVAVLSGRAPLRGLIAGAFGLLVGMVGMDPQTGIMRWEFSQLYLWDGVPLVPVALGVFAVPEIVDLAIKGTRIADVPKEALKGVMSGVRDALSNWFLVARCSTIGVLVGFIPGLGAPVVDWFAYGHAAQTEKGARDSFGKGDVRGVIAPESANNAKEGGALIPTIAFGVPGSASMALLLGGFLIQGLTPGPDLLTKRLDVTYTIIWSLAIANIFGTGLCLLLTNQLARISLIRIHLLVPFIVVVIFLASFQSTRHMGDLISLLFFSFLGWTMKRLAWPRPPLILGLVLSGVLERYLFISMNSFGYSWLTRPAVITIGVLTVANIVYGFMRRRGDTGPHTSSEGERRRFVLSPGGGFSLFMSVVLLGSVLSARSWPGEARLFPLAIGVPALLLSLLQTAAAFFRKAGQEDRAEEVMDLPVDRDVPGSVVARRAVTIFAWVLGLFLAVWVFGFIVTVPLFVFFYLLLQGRERWFLAVCYAGVVGVFFLGVFHYLLSIPWPPGVVPGPQKLILSWIGS